MRNPATAGFLLELTKTLKCDHESHREGGAGARAPSFANCHLDREHLEIAITEPHDVADERGTNTSRIAGVGELCHRL
jgi:hypothetical protein